MRRKTKKKLIKICVLILVFGIGVVIIKINSDKKIVKSEFDISLEKEYISVKKQVDVAWSKALSIGKKDANVILDFVVHSLKNEGVDTDKYLFNIFSKGADVAIKPKGLLVEAGYYKSGTNFNEIIYKWETLYNKRIINYINERLEHIKYQPGKIDIVISSNITEMKDKIFDEELELGTIVIPNSVTKIADKAFARVKFEEIVFNAKIQELNGLFKENDKLKKITFNENISTIRGNTFQEAKIEEVNFIGTLDKFFNIYYSMLYDVPSHSGGCKLYLNGVLYNEIEVPEGVKVIHDYALYNYTNIEKICLPSTIEQIGMFAFKGSSVKEVEYKGTLEMWDKVTKGEEWQLGDINCVVYCLDGEIAY